MLWVEVNGENGRMLANWCIKMPRSRSQSPDEISMFDTSGNDASWATTATEEGERVVRPRAMTRDEAREVRLQFPRYNPPKHQHILPTSILTSPRKQKSSVSASASPTTKCAPTKSTSPSPTYNTNPSHASAFKVHLTRKHSKIPRTQRRKKIQSPMTNLWCRCRGSLFSIVSASRGRRRRCQEARRRGCYISRKIRVDSE